jgi:hypothetical protein
MLKNQPYVGHDQNTEKINFASSITTNKFKAATYKTIAIKIQCSKPQTRSHYNSLISDTNG